MPKPLTINVVKLPARVCEQSEYLVNACPPETIIGHATATSPLLLPGETLSGPVYILRGDGTVLPRLFVRLGGRIFVNVVGKTSFENKTQIRTVFDGLPDAPLSSFTMSVTNLLSTMKEPCQDAREFGGAMTGTLYGHNGRTSDVNAPFEFNCSGNYYRYKFKKRGKKSSLSLWVKSTGDNPSYRKLRLRFSKHLTLANRRALMRRLAIRVNGKRVSRRHMHRSCKRQRRGMVVRRRNKATLDVEFCGRKRVREVSFAFRSRSLISGRRLRRPVLKMTVTDRSKHRTSDRLNLRSKAFRKGFHLP